MKNDPTPPPSEEPRAIGREALVKILLDTADIDVHQAEHAADAILAALPPPAVGREGKVYAVVYRDRHTDPELSLFTDKGQAIRHAKSLAEAGRDEYPRVRAEHFEEKYDLGQWLYWATWTSEEDDVFVVECSIAALPQPAVGREALWKIVEKMYRELDDNFGMDLTTLDRKKIDAYTDAILAALPPSGVDEEADYKKMLGPMRDVLKIKNWPAVLEAARKVESKPFVFAYERLCGTFGVSPNIDWMRKLNNAIGAIDALRAAVEKHDDK